MCRIFLAMLFVLIFWSTPSAAQMFQCPAGSTPVSGGGGMMCQCPDGSFAGLYTGCPSQGPPPSACQPGHQQCGDWCCAPGNYCSKYGCTPQGAVDCGTGYCNPGQACTSNGGCMPAGNTECGNHSCNPGDFCGSRFSCMPVGAADCGSGSSCPAGNKCARDGAALPCARYCRLRQWQVVRSRLEVFARWRLRAQGERRLR